MVMGEFTQDTDVLVIGGGPGGYAAAFRAADLGLDVTLVDAEGRLGGVCLFRGCIPSKTLLYVSELLHDAGRAEEMGLKFCKPEIDLDKLRDWKDGVVSRLANGLMELARKRGIQVLHGLAEFESSERARVHGSDVSLLKFKNAIIATGSTARPLPGTEFKPGGRIMGSTGALELADVPERLLVVGGGYVGVELGSVYASLGSRVTMVEGSDRLMKGADRDLIQPIVNRLEEEFESILVGRRIKTIEERDDSVRVLIDNGDETWQVFDRVLIAVGRQPSTDSIGLEHTAVKTDDRGFIRVDEQRRTTDENIFAIGDAIGGEMLAHKAMHDGKVAAEVIAGQPSAFDYQAIPAVVYTDPEAAWCGLTEENAAKANRPVKISRFPWSASGRAMTMGVKGMTKLVIDPDTGRDVQAEVRGTKCGRVAARPPADHQDVRILREFTHDHNEWFLPVRPHPWG